MRRRASAPFRSQIGCKNVSFLNRKGYRLPAGTFPNTDPHSIYDSNVHHVWKPSIWFDAEKRARTRLREAAEKAFDIKPSISPVKEDGLQELHVRSFFVPYWLVRMGIFGPVDYATMQRDYAEGRISVDVTFSFAGTDHQALKHLHFLSPTTEILSERASTSQPAKGFVYIPFSQALPLSYRYFFENMTEDKDLLISRNVKLRRGEAQVRMAARPVLEPIILGEYAHQGKHITVASSPRLGRDGIRVYSKGTWSHDAEIVGPAKTSFSIAWQGPDPKGIDYKGLGAALQTRVTSWLQTAAKVQDKPSPPSSEMWAGPAVSAEGFDNIRPWREAKLDLWQQGYEMLRQQ